MTQTAKKKDVIKPIQNRLLEITTSFCKQSLDEEYQMLCENMIEKMARKRRVPFLSGRLELWAAAIVYAIGSFNFLQDKSFKPYASSDDIADFFGVSKSTMRQKAAFIKKMFKMNTPFLDMEFATQRMINNSPFKNLAITKDGFIIPISDETLRELK